MNRSQKLGLFVFDLDGVLFDSKLVHFEALNLSLIEVDEIYKIYPEEHARIYDGLSTQKKLEKLHVLKGLPLDTFQEIWRRKQTLTIELLENVKTDYELIDYLEFLRENFFLALASNSIRNTVNSLINKLGIELLFDLVLSNEDVLNPKPHPEIYWKCMSKFGFLPKETVIYEDSHVGRQAAILSGANLIPIENRSDLTLDKIHYGINQIISKGDKLNEPWISKKLNVVIPMAGAGSRFEAAGYTFPKPLIEVHGKPMIQKVVENLNIQANYIFLVQKQHYEKFNLFYLLNLIAPGCTVIQVDGITQGAAVTLLLAKKLIDDDNPLLIANSDQLIEWNSSETMYAFESSSVDGGILTFESTHPKWSYVKLNSSGYVELVAEKKPISSQATVGIYYWRKGSSFVRYAEQMIEKNIRTNNEFYICPVFNEAIKDGCKVKTINIETMWGIGTPEDLKYYLEQNPK